MKIHEQNAFLTGLGNSGIAFQSGVPKNKVAMVTQANIANQEKSQKNGDTLKNILSSAAEIQAQAALSKK